MPPVRSGIIAANSARQKHKITPAAVTSTKSGIAAAPMLCTAKGATPVTKIVPASPMTKAPHQLVFLFSPPGDSELDDMNSSRDATCRLSFFERIEEEMFELL